MLAGGDGAAASVSRALIEGAVELPAFQVRPLLDEADLSSPAGRDRALDEVVAGAGGDGASRSAATSWCARWPSGSTRTPALVIARATTAAAGRGRATRRSSRRGEGRGASRGRRSPTAALSARERREQALLAMCIALPAEGREYLERLTDGAPLAGRRRGRATGCASTWRTRRRPAARRRGAASLRDRAGDECRARAGDAEAMELNFLSSSRRWSRTDRDGRANGGEPPVELQRRRAELAERIARTTS